MLTKHHDIYNRIRYTIGGLIATGFCIWLVVDTVCAHGHVDLIGFEGVELEAHAQWEAFRADEDRYERLMDRMEKELAEQNRETHACCDYDGGWMGSSSD